MLLLCILIILEIQAISSDPYNMFEANHHLDEYCLLYFSRSVYICGDFCPNPIYTEQLMPYCFRPTEDTHSSDFQFNTNLNITFDGLRKMNITSNMLLSWSTTLDIAERYELFLNNYSNSSLDGDVIFYNCTPLWFGPFCHLTTYSTIEAFRNFVDVTFDYKRSIFGDPEITCYIHLVCETQMLCLDWREICDGKADCIDGVDEKNCWQLEMNECNGDEFRCSNGQCIPWEIHLVDSKPGECLDRTNEFVHTNEKCFRDVRFQCEEHTCRVGMEDFPCGDGQCVDELSKCANGRHSFLPRNFCTNATFCFLKLYNQVDEEWCGLFCDENDCIRNNCSVGFEFRGLPLLFGHVRFIVSNETVYSNRIPLPDQICYNATLCPHLSPARGFFHNWTCRSFDDFGLHYKGYTELKGLVKVIKSSFRGCLNINNEAYECSLSTMYQCINSSKCISKHRLMDGIAQCPFGDDEIYDHSCSLSDIRQRYQCREGSCPKCLSLLAVQNGKSECEYGDDEYGSREAFIKTRISFSTICDGHTHLLPLIIDGKNETDETGCESWQCNNTYSRCDNFWLCKNGTDEVDCPSSLCPVHHHRCVFPSNLSAVACLPMDRAGDGIDDCLGGADEQTKYRMSFPTFVGGVAHNRFRCRNDTRFISEIELCNNRTDCLLNDDEIICKSFSTFHQSMCRFVNNFRSDAENFLCELARITTQAPIIFFKLHNVFSYPLHIGMENASNALSVPTKPFVAPENRNNKLLLDSDWPCNRGVVLYSRLPHNMLSISCLCPPSYYGDKCQYQNERVSLTLHIRLTSDWFTTFVFLITLIDTEANIESYEHREHVSTRDCPLEYYIYLLYATRPKNASNIYSVRIDAFTGMTLKYRSTWIFPLQFSFLPVHRLSAVLRVPFSTTLLSHSQCIPSCVHGQCTSYVNNHSSTFCHCESGWSGIRCNIKLKCECASDAICISHSMCLCPPGRFGRQCYLSYSSNHSKPCVNGGQSALNDARYVSIGVNSTTCICPEGYTGHYCEHRQQQTKINIYFHPEIIIPSSLLIHFITAQNSKDLNPNRRSIGRKLQFDQSSLTLHTVTLFNIALAQMLGHYYLIILSEKTISTADISTEVIPRHRCRSLNELFSQTFTSEHLLKRIKSYHLPCQQHRELVCFYDDVHMCLCTLDRSSNCWQFDHNMTYECEKAKYCRDGGECFQDDLTCPRSSFCACHRCYFGSRCQFSTKGSTLSLDIILGYHIRLKTSVSEQPSIVKTSIAFTTLILIFGMINSFLSFQTFRGKETCSVGCGLYLSTTSVVSMMTVVILAMKFALLVPSQTGSLTNRLFLQIQCVSMDFILRSLLSISDWLSACVAIERAFTVLLGVKFSKSKSKHIAKWMIVGVVLLTSCSYLYDPIYRRVMDDEEEERIWCVTQYSSFVQVLDWITNVVHFTLPFVINGISAVIIIITIARTRSHSRTKKSFKEHLQEQFHHHKHLIISPFILVGLALPRLVISFLSGCMGSARESWLYLIGYYISFLPAMMTLFVFILPSELYRKEFQETMKRVWRR